VDRDAQQLPAQVVQRDVDGPGHEPALERLQPALAPRAADEDRVATDEPWRDDVADRLDHPAERRGLAPADYPVARRDPDEQEVPLAVEDAPGTRRHVQRMGQMERLDRRDPGHPWPSDDARATDSQGRRCAATLQID
jgi:hypothetical protein